MPKEIVTLQGMPGIWDDSEFITMVKTILGELANCAVTQSPYMYPDNLSKALKEFHDALMKFIPKSSITQIGRETIWTTSCTKLHDLVKKAISVCPIIQQWNVSKKGNVQISFTSRYDTTYLDYDFIDLDALARNISHNVTLQEKFSKVHYN